MNYYKINHDPLISVVRAISVILTKPITIVAAMRWELLAGIFRAVQEKSIQILWAMLILVIWIPH